MKIYRLLGIIVNDQPDFTSIFLRLKKLKTSTCANLRQLKQLARVENTAVADQRQKIEQKEKVTTLPKKCKHSGKPHRGSCLIFDYTRKSSWTPETSKGTGRMEQKFRRLYLHSSRDTKSINIQGLRPLVARPIEFAGDTDIKSAGIGTIHATLLKSTNGAKLRLKNVLYVPGLSTNLISASQLNKSEIKTYSKLGGKVDILPGDRTLE
ncbi:uncharacterized protein RAG0_09733 [Rhynchosporium agropyri]|uniref:Retrovirus-related Pol polyprotein from transposon TNT 1-94-like beta-barrel domain-containing protein n=1 Tax=Rhynchosporium agropyri TaxID=914238 RepID=A0A1E1KWV2_9HELO|nr:uncharacterized protein RAG0_09733 [Rhynchosporium agropyri]